MCAQQLQAHNRHSAVAPHTERQPSIRTTTTLPTSLVLNQAAGDGRCPRGEQALPRCQRDALVHQDALAEGVDAGAACAPRHLSVAAGKETRRGTQGGRERAAATPAG